MWAKKNGLNIKKKKQCEKGLINKFRGLKICQSSIKFMSVRN